MTQASPSINPLSRIRNIGLVNRPWFNAIWFQSTWFICVLGREPWLPLALVMIAIHFAMVSYPRQEFVALAPVTAAGIIVDAALSRFGVYDFGSELIPVWLCLLWVAFATTLPRALSPLGKNRWIAAVVGGVGVPFNYAVGAEMGAVSLPLEPWLTAAILIPIWSALLPMLYLMSTPLKVPAKQSIS